MSFVERARGLTAFRSYTVHRHLREEEKTFFQVSGKILSAAQKVKLAKQYRRDYVRMLLVPEIRKVICDLPAVPSGQ